MNRIVASLICTVMASAVVAEPICRITPEQWKTFSDAETWAEMEDLVCRGLVRDVHRDGRNWVVMQWVVDQDDGVGLAAIGFDPQGVVTETIWDPNKTVAPDGTAIGFFGPVQVKDMQEMEDQG